MRDALGDAADIRAWTRRYPWAALGASVAAGFVVAAALMPGRRRREDREPALLERILADETISKRLKELAEEDHQRAGSRSQLLQSVAGTLWKTFGPSVQSAFAAAVATKAAQPEDADEQQHATEEGTQSEDYGSV